MPEAYTTPGGELPNDANPGLVYHKIQAWDRFREEPNSRADKPALQPFERNAASVRFLQTVARRVQEVNQERYGPWHENYVASCDDLGAGPPIVYFTWWRLVAGWSTNPSFETGLMLDHLLGFPFVPASAVKGLVHHVAEQSLVAGEDAVPPVPEGGVPGFPSGKLLRVLRRALEIRALFGSLSGCSPDGGKAPEQNAGDEADGPRSTQPPSARDRLSAWLQALEAHETAEGQLPQGWLSTDFDLAHLRAACKDEGIGALVSWFDLVPSPDAFSELRARLQGPILAPDVLTPHTSGKPKPVQFLAVQPGVPFEARFRLRTASSTTPPAKDDPSYGVAAENETELASLLKDWLIKALEQHGLGAKSTAGYGSFSRRRAGEKLPEPPGAEWWSPENEEEVGEEPVSPAEEYARRLLPHPFPGNIAEALDRAIREASPEELRAVARRFEQNEPERLGKWRDSGKKSKRNRLEALGLLEPETE